MNIYFIALLACFWNVDQAVIKACIPQRSWYVVATFCRQFGKYLYLFIHSSHFDRAICLPEVEHKISHWNGVGITFYSVNFVNACPDMIYTDFTILQKGCHNIVNIITLSYVYECCHNVVEMFSYKVLRQHCGNIIKTFLEYVAATKMCQRFHNFPQRCGNVAATKYC